MCVITICLLYVSKKDMNPNSNKLVWSRTQKYHKMLLLFLAIISLLNISIFSTILTMEYVKILYASKKDMNSNSNKLEWSRTQKYHKMLLLFLAIISLLNISIFLLS